MYIDLFISCSLLDVKVISCSQVYTLPSSLHIISTSTIFNIANNKIIFTKKNGETFELDLSSLKGLTREEINSMIINLIASTVETISFDNESNNLVITKKGGTADSVSLDNFLEEEDLDNLKSEIEGKATNLKMESENLQLTSANGTVLSEVSFAATNNTIKELDRKIKEIDASTLKYRVIED